MQDTVHHAGRSLQKLPAVNSTLCCLGRRTFSTLRSFMSYCNASFANFIGGETLSIPGPYFTTLAREISKIAETQTLIINKLTAMETKMDNKENYHSQQFQSDPDKITVIDTVADLIHFEEFLKEPDNYYAVVRFVIISVFIVIACNCLNTTLGKLYPFASWWVLFGWYKNSLGNIYLTKLKG